MGCKLKNCSRTLIAVGATKKCLFEGVGLLGGEENEVVLFNATFVRETSSTESSASVMSVT